MTIKDELEKGEEIQNEKPKPATEMMIDGKETKIPVIDDVTANAIDKKNKQEEIAKDGNTIVQITKLNMALNDLKQDAMHADTAELKLKYIADSIQNIKQQQALIAKVTDPKEIKQLESITQSLDHALKSLAPMIEKLAKAAKGEG